MRSYPFRERTNSLETTFTDLLARRRCNIELDRALGSSLTAQWTSRPLDRLKSNGAYSRVGRPPALGNSVAAISIRVRVCNSYPSRFAAVGGTFCARVRFFHFGRSPLSQGFGGDTEHRPGVG